MSINELNEKRDALLFSLKNPQYKKFYAAFETELAEIESQIAKLSKKIPSRSTNITDKRSTVRSNKRTKENFNSVRYEGGKNPRSLSDRKPKKKSVAGGTASKTYPRITKAAGYRKIGKRGARTPYIPAAEDDYTNYASKMNSRKRAATKKTTRTVKTKPEFAGNYVENIDTQKNLLGRVLKLEGKKTNKEGLEKILRAFSLAKTNNLITKTSTHYALLKKCYEFLYETHDGLARSNSVTPTFAFKPDTLEALKGVVTQVAVYPSIMVLRRYVGFQGKAPAKKTLDAWFKAATKITAKDKYYSKVQEAMRVIRVYEAGKTSSVEISKTALNGLAGLLGK
jgi:hypothetical protein